jgi:hypothetical protein
LFEVDPRHVLCSHSLCGRCAALCRRAQHYRLTPYPGPPGGHRRAPSTTHVDRYAAIAEVRRTSPAFHHHYFGVSTRAAVSMLTSDKLHAASDGHCEPQPLCMHGDTSTASGQSKQARACVHACGHPCVHMCTHTRVCGCVLMHACGRVRQFVCAL